MSEHEIPWLQICDGEAAESEPVKLYGIQGMPAFVLIDDEGNIVERFHWIDYPPDTNFLDLIERRLEGILGN